MKKIILTGLLAGAAMLIANFGVGQLYNFLVPSVSAEYEHAGMFRPWSDPLMSLFFSVPFISGLILAWIWSKTSALFAGHSVFGKAMRFGSICWLLSIPGMIMSYSSFTVSFLLVLSWTLSGFAQYIIGGLVFAKMITGAKEKK
jgi:hypothetical protein